LVRNTKGVKSGSRTLAGQDPAFSAAESTVCRQFENLTQAGMVFKKRHPQKHEISAFPEIGGGRFLTFLQND